MTNGILLTRHNQEIAQWSPDPFPRERVGSGHETSGGGAQCSVVVANDNKLTQVVLHFKSGQTSELQMRCTSSKHLFHETMHDRRPVESATNSPLF